MKESSYNTTPPRLAVEYNAYWAGDKEYADKHTPVGRNGSIRKVQATGKRLGLTAEQYIQRLIHSGEAEVGMVTEKGWVPASGRSYFCECRDCAPIKL